ncbi:MAG: J domain-containing protein [Planctomycetes bacterium]|nr:J domain-containing protein [Planctomycetota bacterium]
MSDRAHPFEILGVSPEARDQEIREAYLRKVKLHPPERDPDAFERIRDAYEALRDPRRRARSLLRGADPKAPIASLLDGRARERQFVGPGPWLDVVAER